jgi:alpha-tubulin suppressor-like RCC1 family protein
MFKSLLFYLYCLSVADLHLCIIVIAENGEIKTWGWGEHGQLGLGNTCDQISPQSVSLSHNPNEAATYELYCGSGFTFAIMNPCDPSQT